MQLAQPSRTALRVALRRAAHQLYDSPLVFPDPFAIAILGPAYAEELRRTPNPEPDQRQRAYSVAMRAHLVARSRYAEDTLHRAVRAGVTQYVLLGAGLDTFAHRNPYAQLRVFEVDHPATQAWKRGLLNDAGLPHPSGLTYAPIDFEVQSLPAELAQADFRPTAPTVFAMLGVVPYLTLSAFRSTIAFIAARAAGSAVIFDYGQPRHALNPNEQLAHDSLAARVAAAGEPFQLYFTPTEAADELATFRTIEDLGATELNARYFSNRSDNLNILGSARMLSAHL